MKRYSVLLILTLSILAGRSASARELFESNLSVRALGMGNAYVSVVKDAYTLFYNPARLTHVEGFNFRLMDPYLLVSDPREVQAVIDSQTSGQELADILEPFFDTNANSALGARAAFTMPYFGFALYGDAGIGLDLANPVLPDLNIRGIVDYGGVIGLGIPILPVLSLGMTVKRITRQGGIIPISATTVAELNLDQILTEIERKGTAFGLDLGATFSIPGPLDAAVSFVWENVGGMSFKHTGGPGAPPSERDEMIVGAAAGFDLPLFGVTAALDIKHLDDPDVQLGKKIHVGVEVNLINIDVRAGLHQGYYTLGAGVSLGLIDLDIATYGVELGEYPGQKEDRRYAIQLTLELGVGGFLGIGGSSSGQGADGKGGKRSRPRGIKQRR